LQGFAFYSGVSLSGEISHTVSRLPQDTAYGSWTPIELRDKVIQVGFALNESFIRIPIISNPDQDLQIAWLFGFTGRKDREVYISELDQFCGIHILFAEVEAGQFDVLVLAGTLRDEVLKTNSVSVRQPARNHGLFVSRKNEYA
jgi:hypothetical protein